MPPPLIGSPIPTFGVSILTPSAPHLSEPLRNVFLHTALRCRCHFLNEVHRMTAYRGPIIVATTNTPPRLAYRWVEKLFPNFAAFIDLFSCKLRTNTLKVKAN